MYGLVDDAKRRVRKALKRRLFDIGGAKDAAFIAGMGRSGTTWIADVANYDGRRRIMFEPFHAGHVEGAEVFTNSKYLERGMGSTEMKLFMDKVVSGKVRGKWVDRDSTDYLYRSRIIKVIRCNLMLSWIRELYDDVPIILTIRNPYKVISSWLKMGWPTDFEEIIGQQEFVEAYPVVAEALKKLDTGDYFDRLLFLWCVYNAVPLSHYKNENIKLCVYEKMILDPELEIGNMMSYMGYSMDWSRIKHMLNQQSSTNFVDRNFSDVSAKVLIEPGSDFDSYRVNRVNYFVSMFGLDYLYDPKGYPM